MQPIRIYPQYALVFTYNIRSGQLENYYSFVTGDLISELQRHKLYIEEVWHVTYGDVPERQVEFVTESMVYIRKLFDNPKWLDLESELQRYTENYQRRVVRYRKLKLVR